jgi:hypothetical protein
MDRARWLPRGLALVATVLLLSGTEPMAARAQGAEDLATR